MRIFVDLDGVLIDSTIPMMNHWLPRKIREFEYPSAVGWNIVAATNYHRSNQGVAKIDPHQFWSPFGHAFWADRKPYQEARSFLKVLEGYGDVYLATSPTLDPGSASGKHACIAEHIPEYLRRLIIGPCKHLLARPDAILIDDADMNCINFAIEGGQTILFPRPWNPRGLPPAGSPYELVLKDMEILCTS